MKTQSSSIQRAGGFTYLTVVITMIVVGFMLAAYLKMVTVQNQLTVRSQTWNRSVPVLEAGVEEAMAHLNKSGSPDASGNLPGTLNSDNWSGDAAIGWSKFGWLDKDFYFVQISPWVAGSH
jgi:Tfp pilus assembly protein PilX